MVFAKRDLPRLHQDMVQQVHHTVGLVPRAIRPDAMVGLKSAVNDCSLLLAQLFMAAEFIAACMAMIEAITQNAAS